MLDLHAGVHLQEEVLRRTLPVGGRGQQALDRARPDIVDRASRLHADLSDPLPKLSVHGRRRRLLDQLLVAPLDRAVALAEVNDIAVPVCQHLHLHVAGVRR